VLPSFGNTGPVGNAMGLTMLLLLCAYMVWDSRRVRS
jgi:hypothetical protein